MLHRVLKARLQVGPEAFQDTPPNRRGDPKVGACDGRSRESGHGLPKQPQGVTGVLRGLSTPGGSGVCPRDKQKLARHRSQGCAPNAPEDRTRHPAGQRTHPGSWEWPAPVDRP